MAKAQLKANYLASISSVAGANDVRFSSSNNHPDSSVLDQGTLTRR